MELVKSIFDNAPKTVEYEGKYVRINFDIDVTEVSLGNTENDNVGDSKDKKKTHDKESIVPIVLACMNMSKKKVGALIVIERLSPLDEIVKTGDLIDANINQRLIENIFFKNSPLHDGAMIIAQKRIKAAGCILPVSHDMNIPKELGLRHRAAMGMSQDSDSVVIVVSEETGSISVAIKGQFQLRLSAEKLESILTKELN